MRILLTKLLLSFTVVISSFTSNDVNAEVAINGTYILFETDKKAKANPSKWCAVPPGSRYIYDVDTRRVRRCFVVSADGKRIPSKPWVEKKFYPDFAPPVWEHPVKKTHYFTHKLFHKNPDRGLFFLHPVDPNGYILLGNHSGITPYLDIKPGKINYIGSFSIQKGKWNMEFKPDGLEQILSETGERVSKLHLVEPRAIHRECRKKGVTGLTNVKICSTKLLSQDLTPDRFQFK